MSDGMSEYMSEKLSEQLSECISYFMSWWDHSKQSNVAYYPCLCFLGHRHFFAHCCILHARAECCALFALVARVCNSLRQIHMEVSINGGTPHPQVIIHSKATNHLWGYESFLDKPICVNVVPGWLRLGPRFTTVGDRSVPVNHGRNIDCSNRSATPGG